MRVLALLYVTACGRWGFSPFDAAAHDGGDGGAVDAVRDAPADAAPACPPSAIVCDDWEAGNLAKWSGRDLAPGSASVVVTNTIAHAGTRCLDCTVPNTGAVGEADVFLTFGSPISTGTLAARLWVYSPQPLGGYSGVLTLYTSSAVYALVAADNNNKWTVSEDSSGGGLIDHHSQIATIGSVWTCVEIDYTFGTPSQIEMFVADTRVLAASAADPSPSFAVVRAGLTRTAPTGAHAYFDDVVVARAHIGCN